MRSEERPPVDGPREKAARTSYAPGRSELAIPTLRYTRNSALAKTACFDESASGRFFNYLVGERSEEMGTLYLNDMLSSVREDHVKPYPAVADRKSRPIHWYRPSR